MPRVPRFAIWQSGEELVVLVLNCIQLTSQEFDCVYEIIWCQKHCSRWAFRGDRGFQLKANHKKILTGFPPILRRVLNDPLGNISASQKLGRKKKKEPGKTTQLAKRELILTLATASSRSWFYATKKKKNNNNKRRAGIRRGRATVRFISTSSNSVYRSMKSPMFSCRCKAAWN